MLGSHDKDPQTVKTTDLLQHDFRTSSEDTGARYGRVHKSHVRFQSQAETLRIRRPKLRPRRIQKRRPCIPLNCAKEIIETAL